MDFDLFRCKILVWTWPYLTYSQMTQTKNKILFHDT